MRTLDLDLGDERRTRKVQLASAAVGLSSAEFIRASVDAAIRTMAGYDAILALMLQYEEDWPGRAAPKAREGSH